jgi:hypothetical protein
LYHLRLGLPSDLFPSGFSTKTVHFASPSKHHVPQTPYSLRFYRSSNIWRDVKVKFIYMLFSPACSYCLALWQKFLKSKEMKKTSESYYTSPPQKKKTFRLHRTIYSRRIWNTRAVHYIIYFNYCCRLNFQSIPRKEVVGTILQRKNETA